MAPPSMPTAAVVLRRTSPRARTSTLASAALPDATDDDRGTATKDKDTNDGPAPQTSSSSPRRRRRRKSASTTQASKNDTSPVSSAAGDDDDNNNVRDDTPKKPSATTTNKRPPKAPAHQVLTHRDPIPKLWTNEMAAERGSYTFRIASWNVCGLRALLRKDPTCLQTLVHNHSIDVLCLQETKLQPIHSTDNELRQALSGYDSYWSCCTDPHRKGYAGTAAFVKRHSGTIPPTVDPEPGSVSLDDRTDAPAPKKKAKKAPPRQQTTLDAFVIGGAARTNDLPASIASNDQYNGDANSPISSSLTLAQRQLLVPERVSFDLGNNGQHDTEGRIVALDFPLFSLINVYVPNSGQALARLSYRTDEWDRDLLAFAQSKLTRPRQQQQQQGKKDKVTTNNTTVPVMWLGDLNVAHAALDVWNDGAKHLATQAGVTPQERASFQHQLDAGFVDAFRHFHPTAQGQYSYWSQRAGNRPPNKGLRLDYFVGHQSFFEENAVGHGEDTLESEKAPTPRAVVRDSYILPEQLGSDHCPVVVELEIQL